MARTVTPDLSPPMSAFRDTAGRLWWPAVTVDGLWRVRALADIDLLRVLDDDADLFDRLADDVVLLIDVLYALLLPEADRRNLSDVDFGRSFSGDVIESASDALTAGILGFFPTRTDIRWPDSGEAQPPDGSRASERAERFVWELAGILGVSPGPFTLRDLVRMAQARQREAWGRLSHLLAAVANVLAGPRDRRVTPAECDPFRAAAGRLEPDGIRVGSGALRRWFPGSRAPTGASS